MLRGGEGFLLAKDTELKERMGWELLSDAGGRRSTWRQNTKRQIS